MPISVLDGQRYDGQLLCYDGQLQIAAKSNMVSVAKSNMVSVASWRHLFDQICVCCLLFALVSLPQFQIELFRLIPGLI